MPETTAKVVMVESYPAELAASLKLESKSLAFAANVLKREHFIPFYEFSTGILTQTQRGFFEEVASKAPKDIQILLDPLNVSFAVRDACDLSGADYVWLDVERENDVGSSVWTKEEHVDKVQNTVYRLIKAYFGKYILDAYDRRTREDLEKAWTAGLKLSECQVCGATLIDRTSPSAKLGGVQVRGWKCSNCGFQKILPSDVIELVERKVKD